MARGVPRQAEGRSFWHVILQLVKIFSLLLVFKSLSESLQGFHPHSLCTNTQLGPGYVQCLQLRSGGMGQTHLRTATLTTRTLSLLPSEPFAA